jgi:hypothetical protein
VSITLPSVLKGIDWQANIDAAFADSALLAKIENALQRIAQWAAQLESVDHGNPALCFIREAQIAAHQCSALIGLCLYKAAATSARTMVETLLYYTYFRTHPSELTTLVRVEKYYVSKSEILEYHRMHTPKFMELQEIFGLLGNLEAWYSKVSAVIHGQIPGAWNAHSALREIGFSKDTHELAVECFVSGEVIFHQIMLCTCGKQIWAGFTPFAKTFLLKGIPGDKKTSLSLDSK